MVYDATESRCRDGPLEFLKDFRGYLQCDAYAGYDELFRQAKGSIVEVGCWAHARRKFVEAQKTSSRVLSNEKYRGVRVSMKPDLMMIQAHNPEQEEAEDEVEVNYKGDEVEIGFNVNYLLDALSAIDTDRVEIGLTDANSSCLIRAPGTTNTKYVVMPMRL